MPSIRTFPIPFAALLLAVLLPAPPATALDDALPVVVALDSSRSLSPAESAAAVGLVRELAARLAPGAPLALLTFDDEVRWLATAPGAPGETLDAVVPRGRYTLLHDGLVEAIRRLGEGGALVVISDGKDENSATTLEDVARLAGAAGVRVVAVGAGRADGRALRRLALLTGGVFAGTLDGMTGDRLAAEVDRLRAQMASEREARAAQAAAPPPAPTPVATPPPPPPAAPSRSANWALALIALAAAGALGFWLARRRPQPADDRDEIAEVGTAPGIPMPAARTEPGAPAAPLPPPLDADLESQLLARSVVGPGMLFEISFDETAAFESLPRLDPFERTLVLTEETVLTVREHGHEARRFRLPPQQAVSIGRDEQRNTLAFNDPTLSAQHLRVVLQDEAAYLVDLGSTNGVYLREERVRSARLRPGDRFRAGLLEFELQVRQQSLT